MTNNLAAEIEKVLELDKNRTQGEWKCGESMESNGYNISYVGTDINHEYRTGYSHLDGYNFSARTRDAEFIALAPRMVEIIKALQAENERLKLDLGTIEAIADVDIDIIVKKQRGLNEKHKAKITVDTLHCIRDIAKQALSTPSDGSGK